MQKPITKRNRLLAAIATNEYLHLYDVVKASERYSPEYIGQSLNLLAAEWGGNVQVVDGTSHPNFAGFLNAINPTHVGDVVIGSRTDRNTNVGVTLDCTLHWAAGTVTVTPDWTCYKDIRATEVMSTLLRPLRTAGLFNRLTIKTITGREKGYADDFDGAVNAVVDLDGHNELYDAEARRRFVDIIMGESR